MINMTMTDGIIDPTPIDRIAQVIGEKKIKNQQLKFAINDHISFKLEYMKKSNDLLLNTDFKKVLNESRPTVAMKEAYIDNELFTLKSELEISKENISAIKRDIEILDNELKMFEYEIQMELQNDE